MRYATSSLFLIVSITVPLRAQPLNDQCEGATPIQGFGDFAFDLIEASDSPLAVTNCFNATGTNRGFTRDIWFAWEPGVPNLFGPVTIETCGLTSVDTKIAVYDDSCAELTQPLVCDDDTCLFQSRVVVQVDHRVTYLIRVATQPGLAGGTGSLRIQRGEPELPNPNDLGCPSPLLPLLQPVALETCNARDRFDALNSTRTQFSVVDDFVPAESGTLEGACWYGTYLRDAVECRRNFVDFFEITYYADDCGVPGDIIAGPFSQEVVAMEVIGPLETYAAYPNLALEYQFSAAHDPVAVEGGRTYWIGITNSLYNNCSWYWGLASGHNGYALQIDEHDGSVTPLRSDLAFCSRIVESDGPVCDDHPPLNDDCSDAIRLFDDEVAFDTYGATTDGPINVPDYHPLHPAPCDFLLGDEQVHRDVWYRF